jgi:WD40 repeat protein
MFRRVFLRRLFHGLGIAAAVELVLDADQIAPKPDKQKSDHVVLYLHRQDDPANPYTRIDWFDQRPGDTVVAIWRDGTCEAWKVTTVPYWTHNEYGRVECVGCEQVLARGPLLPGIRTTVTHAS